MKTEHVYSGTFITFEGPDGSGKTSQMQKVVSWLEKQSLPILQTREPGGTRIGEKIRDVLHDTEHVEMSSQAEILLYSASRAQIVSELILPALHAGKIVLCDRYYDSTYAYQGYGRGLDLDALRQITEFATQHLRPDVTLYLDVKPEVGLQRRMSGGGEINRLDREALSFHQRVREGYLQLVEQEPDRWRVIDANQEFGAVMNDIRTVLRRELKLE